MELPVDTAFDKYGGGLGKQLEGEIKLPQERPERHAQKYDGRIGEDVGQEDDQQASFRADLKEGGKGKLDQQRKAERDRKATQDLHAFSFLRSPDAASSRMSESRLTAAPSR